MKGVFTHFVFKGRNFEKALSKMQRLGISVYKIRKTAKDKLFFCCESKDEQKIFANFSDSCYNIEKIKYSGILYPFKALWQNTGVLIGAAVFLILIILSNMLIFRIQIKGTGEIYSEKILNMLDKNEIKTFSLFYKLDYKVIEKQILNIEGVNFVSAERIGNTLIIDVRLATTDSEPKNRIYKDLVSSAKGEVLSITAIRGTPLVKEGDTVEINQSLIGAYYTTREEEKIQTFVIGRIELKCNAKIMFESAFFDDDAKAKAIAYARVILKEKEILEYSFSEVKKGDKNYIEVNCYYVELITEADFDN